MTQTPPGSSSLTPPSGPVAGWYPDPYFPGVASLRYWDGSQWTYHVAGRSPARPVAMTPDGEPLAGWGDRLLAYLIDGWIFSAVAMVPTAPFLVGFLHEIWTQVEPIIRAYDADPNGPLPGFHITAAMVWWFVGYSLVATATLFGYHAVFLRWKQATPGKMALGLRVRLRDQPGPLTWSVVRRRLIAQFWPALFAFVPVLGSLLGAYAYVDGLWALGNDERQTLHDRFAGTNVVKRPAR